jgi:hypothetical protein
MNKLVLPVAIFLSLFSTIVTSDQYTQFWSWFQQDENQYYKMDFDNYSQRNILFDKLSTQLNHIDENLTFEFGKLPDGRMNFVISAGGIVDTFPEVIKLAETAPKFKNWKITAFRQAQDIDTTIEIGDAKVDPKETSVQLYRDGERIGIVLYMPEFKETPNQLYEQLGFLLLDQTLGEYVVGTKVGFIEFKKKTDVVENSFKLNEINQFF